MGDIHQPLHAGKKKDLGGNLIRVKWFDERTNLHKVWDDGLIDSQKLSYTEYISFIYKPTPEMTKWKRRPSWTVLMKTWTLEKRYIVTLINTRLKKGTL